MNGLQVYRRLGALAAIFAISVVVATIAHAQGKPSYGQQIAVLKLLQPDLKVIGVMSSNLSDKEIQDITRAGLGQGEQIVVGIPQDPRDISQVYKKMVSEKKIQILWVPKSNDDLMMGVGFEYLRTNTLLDKVGLCIPDPSLLASGALCSVQIEGGKLTVYVNQKIASVLGAHVPTEESSSVTYVSR
ncbi:MAG TPA: hypothetical protein VMG34_05345 [Bacteroidota bacterium]|nr:hypothetical protein [Bacteroidota bacterium]